MEKRYIKSTRIIRILLAESGLTKYRIAKKAGCSGPWVIEFLRKLEEKKLIKNTRVLDPNKLIDYYIEIMPKIKYFDFYVQNPIEFFKKTKLKYALTTYAAENFFTKQLFLTRYDAYIEEADYPKWKADIMKNGLFGKGNLRLLFSYDKNIFVECMDIKGVKIVSKEQLLIDLKREGGVSMESYFLLLKQNV